ncbi:hypothetical protein [Olivibacter domesticus]|nr:hypothetical protein [Olivibacter domesticus]
MGRYHNAVGELQYTHNDPDNPVYQQETVLYQDPDWGDLFVNATLLYDEQEVFLDQYYSKSGNVIFDGVNAAMGSHDAALTETSVFANTAAYKTGVYWARTSSRHYLLGFYQRDKLIFEVAIPLRASDTLATLVKLNTVNEKLGLHVREWQQATTQQLQPVDTQETFWKNPFVGLYMEEPYLLHRVSLKIKDTPFREARTAIKGDHYFSYDTPTGKVELFTVVKDTYADRDAFDATHQNLSAYEANGQRVYYDEQETGGKVKGIAQTYFKSGKFLTLHYEYPQAGGDEAKAIIHRILRHVRVRML